jgi:hypothetical protein
MAAHTPEHAMACPAKGNGRLIDCTCDAPGAAKAQGKGRDTYLSPGELVNEVENLGAEPPSPAAHRRAMFDAFAASGPETVRPACRRCSECEGEEHHWLEASFDDFDDEIDDDVIDDLPEYECKHCPARCRAIDDDDGLSLPSGQVLYINVIDSIDPQHTDMLRLHKLSQTVSSMSGRLVSLARGRGTTHSEIFEPDPKNLPIAIRQVCPACREQHEVHIGEPDSELATVAAVGLAARKARIGHRCPPVEALQTDQLTPAELEALEAELERDGTKMIARSIEIGKLAAAARSKS